MERIWPQHSGDGPVDPEIGPTDVQTLTGVELDSRIRAGWDDWCELIDALLNTGGMLPSPDLAERVVSFFADGYWRAEAARVEALKRQLAENGLRRPHFTDQSRGFR